MSNLVKVVRQLKMERDQARKRLAQLDEALKALTGVSGLRGRATGQNRALSRKRRTMSLAGRKKIARAQRARWAKWKASQKA
jgi:hypothetical protein